MKNIFAYTALGPSPAYCSINEDEQGVVIVTVRAKDGRESSVEIPKAEAALLQQGEPEGALRKAYNKIEQHMFDYTHETHSYDASTNAWECSNGEVVAYVEGLDKALEIIKPLLSASPLPPAPGAETGE